MADPAAFESLANSSFTRPCSAKGAGSTPRRVNLSDSDAKHRRAPSETCAQNISHNARNSKLSFAQLCMNLRHTWVSSCLSRVDKASTHAGRDGSCGSILVQSLDTTAIAECKVSLCTLQPLSRMNDKTQLSPPPSKTAPASRVQINSNT